MKAVAGDKVAHDTMPHPPPTASQFAGCRFNTCNTQIQSVVAVTLSEPASDGGSVERALSYVRCLESQALHFPQAAPSHATHYTLAGDWRSHRSRGGQQSETVSHHKLQA